MLFSKETGVKVRMRKKKWRDELYSAVPPLDSQLACTEIKQN
jgi:hypothetical protein